MGLAQARAAALRIRAQWKVEAVVTSDLKRAVQTAREAASLLGLPVARMEEARERREVLGSRLSVV